MQMTLTVMAMGQTVQDSVGHFTAHRSLGKNSKLT
jgi:hypothetical protein